jgi:hypothetical protein
VIPSIGAIDECESLAAETGQLVSGLTLRKMNVSVYIGFAHADDFYLLQSLRLLQR